MSKTLEEVIKEAVQNAVSANLQNENTTASTPNPNIEIQTVDSQSLETNASSGYQG
jgi:hypothetical protein